ncbi:MAG TPA: ParB/RepB/Spo0J family partition protein [Candidatus Binataceae bacterium]|nr:ParB/RepB/Spo0J family partition protein [Candidatus Binataceae bacterium]
MVRRPLGRGLDALIENTALDDAAKPAGRGAARDGQLLLAPVARITPSPFQPRLVFDPERLQELANAIKIQGVLEPLLVRLKPDAPAGGAAEYELIAGERRLRAAKLAGLETVPVIVRELDDRNALEVSLVENLAREQLNPIEEARAFAALNRQFMLSHDTIADRVGKSRPYVTNQIRLLELPEEVVHLVVQGKLTTGQARPLLALPGKQERINAARRISRAVRPRE